MASVTHTRTRSTRLFGSARQSTASLSAPTRSNPAANTRTTTTTAPNTTTNTFASATSAATGPSIGSIVASNQASNLPSPSSLTLFLSNLKLLDLDASPDWPDITVETFATTGSSAQGQKKRVQCVEWALYQLFVIWDPAETKNKLKPFFPPLEQVQSVNLRAALVRALEQAKKNGVLSRDVLVRKTMLDDCKGERLHDILAAFSSAVLKKVIAEEEVESKEYPPIALRLALEERGYSRGNIDVALLGLAHKASLRGLLEQKTALRKQFHGFSEILGAKEEDIVSRKEAMLAKQQDGSSKTLSKDLVGEMRRTIRNNWTGNEHWMETLLTGDTGNKKDAVLGTPFDRVWRRVRQGRLHELQDEQGGLLADLEGRVQAQQRRLEKWEGFKRQMCEGRPTNSPVNKRSADSSTKGIDMGFYQHESLQVRRANTRRNTVVQKEPELNEDYGTLLRDLQDDLAQTEPQRTPALSFLQQPRRLDTYPEVDACSAENEEDEVVSEMSELEDDVGAKDLFVEAEPSKSFQDKLTQCKPRPVRPRISLSGNSSPSKCVDERHPRASRGYENDERHDRFDGSPDRHGQTLRLKKVRESRAPSPPPIEPTPSPLESELDPTPSPTQDMADQILESMDTASPSPVKRSKPRPTLSLADRTRLSLTRKPSLFLEDEPDSPEGSAPVPTTPSPAETPLSTGDELEDLASRTRRSMVGYEKARQKAQLERRRSQRKAQESPRKEGDYFPKVDSSHEQAMLAEELIAEEDMEAVFKSRPKIKASPLPSPTLDGWGDDFF